jgi:hypothetical protein
MSTVNDAFLFVSAQKEHLNIKEERNLKMNQANLVQQSTVRHAHLVSLFKPPKPVLRKEKFVFKCHEN